MYPKLTCPLDTLNKTQNIFGWLDKDIDLLIDLLILQCITSTDNKHLPLTAIL